MLKNLFKYFLQKSGKTYLIDDDIPNRLIISVFWRRFIMLCRGYLFLRKRVFLGNKVKIRNKSNIDFSDNCTLEDYVKIDAYSKNKIRFGNNLKIGAFSILSSTSHFSRFGAGIKIGNNSAIGEHSFFGAAGGIIIGENVIMGQYISFHSENHSFDDKDTSIREQGTTSQGIVLGNNIWVGAKVTFLDGAEIGDNCVIAAGAIVKGKFPDNSLIGGVPAKIIKMI
ncbi:MAG: acyltransferase [Bacteroidales bacterium]|jgi:acetyltransferase-like isoleucine patch superfamily enzyme|nr:acyltransferase [Bacteroidales bacterium]